MRKPLWVMRVATLAVASTMTGSCERTQRTCADELAGRYRGVALALSTGDASFATRPDCGVFVAGDESFYAAVQRAWASSPYEGELRPISVEIEGSIEPNDKPDFAPIFRVQSFAVSPAVDDDAAREQFRKRMGRLPPKRRD